ncbi:hypothetical protein KFK09_013820 [Dendrobium nobile]|uniref:Uncharacterized protein n=1 Tax=Dendrobium nobile TaxID=94219 RepID=A0A8T3BAT0_DENNO|nr:hypothetical protein KFK09_013820 [Dendrobium nobile]
MKSMDSGCESLFACFLTHVAKFPDCFREWLGADFSLFLLFRTVLGRASSL